MIFPATRIHILSSLLLTSLLVGFSAAPLPGHAQFQEQRYTLTEAERQALTEGRDHLRHSLDVLQEQARKTGQPRADQIPDVEIFLDAVDRNLSQDMFFSPQNVAQAKACLAEGEERAKALVHGEAPWERQTGVVVFGYRSKVDGSAQPYQVYVPAGYDYAAPKPQRLDIFLHGRGGNLNELTFLSGKGWVLSSFGADHLEFLALYPYGRGNNGWRFAGEQDVFEALADCKRRFAVEADQTSLRGFSMGGHGCWHIGLQHPGLWSVMSPGAGFVDTKHYQMITTPLPAWQEALLHLYDPLDYAANAFNLPLLDYVGELDPARSQHQLIEAALEQAHAPFKAFLGPKTPHRYEPQALQAILAEMAGCRRTPNAPFVDFITYTLRFPECKWVRLAGLERHWERSETHARVLAPGHIQITTRNVSALQLTPPGMEGVSTPQLQVDGQTVALPAYRAGDTLSLVKKGGHWTPGTPKGLRKAPGLQGPIDDALFGPVLAVTGAGTPWSEPMARWTRQELQRFRDGWGRYFRATLPEKTDTALTAEDIRDKNLYLFGDPGSNAVLKRLLPRLPLRWTPDAFTLAGKTFSTHDHLPMLVFPNPESPQHYIVIDTGFTFSQADWQGSNARQYPHLPDYAVIHFDPAAFSDNRATDTVLAGFFDEEWRLPRR